jgi:hypothetical protein
MGIPPPDVFMTVKMDWWEIDMFISEPASPITSERQPPAYEADFYGWNLRRVPTTALINGESKPHPTRHSVVFVVHGMGEQQWTETSASLRCGFEDALEVIRKWQADHLGTGCATAGEVPPPFTYEGYWANYADLEATFPEDWQQFNKRERTFFQHLWDTRAYSAMRTYLWLLGRQILLIGPRRIDKKTRVPVWLLYWPLQIIGFLALTVALVRAPKILTRILADVRLYANPQGIAEHAIVQRIDYRVGREFLRLIGLDWDFRPLPPPELVTASGMPFVFDRVVWVAHSLGTVVSYNVLSDLFRRAAQLDRRGDHVQQEGVRKFRDSLRRFVTLGSPLNKFASLFPNALRPWHTHDRPTLLPGGDITDGRSKDDGDDKAAESREWWINYYHVLDPVSGALHNRLICGETPPVNIHTDWKASALVPGLAHLSYWRAAKVSRFILSRVYGRAYLPDEWIGRQSLEKQIRCAVLGYFIWAVLLFGGLVLLFLFRHGIFQGLWHALKSGLQFLIGA